MDFPNGFNTPTFPAGPRVALSRVVAIGIMVVFLLIVVVCGMLLWAQRSAQVHPFLVSVNNITGQWQIVGHNHDNVVNMSAERALKESVIGKFLQSWFLVSLDEKYNENTWASCNRDADCIITQSSLSDIDSNQCALYCVSGDELYTDFKQKIAPKYQELAQNGITWYIDMPSLQITPIESGEKADDLWQVRVKIINTNIVNPTIDVLGYVKIGQNADVFPNTMGYFVSEFNAYKMN